MGAVTAAGQGAQRLEWGVAARALPGESESGDLHVVRVFDGGALVGVVDALGHGPPAAVLARDAVAVLEDHAREPPEEVVHRCHEALRGTRGVVLSVASIRMREATMAFVGVGNIETVLVAGDAAGRGTLLTRSGVVGGNMPPLRAATIPVASGDMLCFATDGIDPAFMADRPHRLRPQEWADAILTKHWRRWDDALVLVVRIPDWGDR